MTGHNWPAESVYTVTDDIYIRSLNHIEVIHIKRKSIVGHIRLSLKELDDMITALTYAKYYLEKGKYYE